MEDTLEEYQDLALVIAWPDQTARGDEAWMSLLKKIGVVKNLNFRVGHAAILLVERCSGQLAYYDFGRYITPRGYGRARSAASDPRLTVQTLARVNGVGHILNLQEILNELSGMEEATHGGGRLFFSVAQGLSFRLASQYAQGLVDAGPIKYGALAAGNNSCSRFVAQVLLAGWAPGIRQRRSVALPECLKPSPMSNVVNASYDGVVCCYHDHTLIRKRMTRWHSLALQMDLLLHNLSAKRAKHLPCDQKPGCMDEPPRPPSVPKQAQWLGGIGEGAWYVLEWESLSKPTVTRYGRDGQVDYRVNCQPETGFNPDQPYAFTYDCHYQRHVVVQNGQSVLLKTCMRTASYVRTA